MNLIIRYKRVRDIADLSVTSKGEWIDLHLAEDVRLSPGEFKLLPLGIRMKLPEGFEAHIAPRSSTFKNYKIIQVNSVGIVDSSYCGPNDEWKMPVYATEAVVVQKNTRICQFRIMPSQFADKDTKYNWLNSDGVRFVEQEWLEGNEESRGGFGSTGN
mgnify:CR=1 FL=1